MNPVAEACVNLSLVVPAEEARRLKGDPAGYFDAAACAWPGLGARLQDARRAGPVRALGPLAYTVSPPVHDGVLLVGDAAGFLDPFTGEGLYAALRSAELAAEVASRALAAGDVTAATLHEAHERRVAAFAAKTRLTLLLQRLIARRGLAVLAARLLARHPAHLERLMGVLGDFIPARALLAPAFLAGLARPGRLAGPVELH
jgi:flavin-dependent dehydrogenase